MTSKYKRPVNIGNDMGGIGDNLDQRMSDIVRLLDFAPNDIKNLLDIGMGQGQLSKRFLEKGVKVTGTGLELESYGVDVEAWAKKGVKVVECPVEKMPFEDASFDAVLASHILEHVPNMQVALQEIRRVLKDNGWLLLFIPPYEDATTPGHINTGWNLGRLIYVLILNGFDVKSGKFIKYGFSLCAYVKKCELKLPPLRGDRGDIQILADANMWPFEILPTVLGDRDSFDGEIISVNWENAEDLLEEREKRWGTSIGGRCSDLFASVLYKILGQRFSYGLATRLLRKGRKVNPEKVSTVI